MANRTSPHHAPDPHGTAGPPWTRPAEPDHPMLVDGGVVNGDTRLMFRCMVEEYLLAGHSAPAILAMCDMPNYQAFHAAMLAIGREAAATIVHDAATRVGCHRTTASESPGHAQSATLTIGATT